MLDELRDGERFVLTTHEHPDGDALGSLAAMQQVLCALGKDAVSYLAADEFPLPYEYRFIELPQLVTTVPDDVEDRTVVFLDCGNIDRNPADGAQARPRGSSTSTTTTTTRASARSTTSCRDASCTAEVIWDLMRGLGVELTQPIAEALYVGLVTDTGRFMYENTGSRAHVMAAELIGAGIDVHAIYRRLYEGVPQGKLELLARGLSAVERFDGGLLTRDPADARGLRASPAPTRATPRASSTTCARSRAPRSRGSCASCCPTARRDAAQGLAARDRRPRRRLGDRARARRRRAPARGRLLDRPRVRRARRVPARAARRSSCEPLDRDGVLLVDKPAGVTSHDVVAAERRRLARGAKVGHAGTLDPFATGLLLVLIGRATRAQRFLMALPKRYETVARLGCTSTTGDPEGEIAPGRMPPEPLALPTGRIRQRPPAYSAVRVGGKRAYALARAGEAVELPEREVEVHALRAAAGATASARRSRSSAARAPTCAR